MTVLERKEREFQQREEAILAAALSLFNRDDWQTVTIDQIAAKAEIGKGTIYKHFESKDQIYAKLVVKFHRQILQELGRIDLTQAPLKVIGETLDVFWRAHGISPEHKRLARYCEREDFKRTIGPKMSQELDALDNELNSIIIPVIERGIKEGALVDRPVEHLMLSLHASMVGLIEMDGVECVQTTLNAEQKYQVIKEFALRGISKR